MRTNYWHFLGGVLRSIHRTLLGKCEPLCCVFGGGGWRWRREVRFPNHTRLRMRSPNCVPERHAVCWGYTGGFAALWKRVPYPIVWFEHMPHTGLLISIQVKVKWTQQRLWGLVWEMLEVVYYWEVFHVVASFEINGRETAAVLKEETAHFQRDYKRLKIKSWELTRQTCNQISHPHRKLLLLPPHCSLLAPAQGGGGSVKCVIVAMLYINAWSEVK